MLADVDTWGASYGDLVMRNDGRLYSMTSDAADPNDALLGQFREFSTADGTLVYSQDDGIATYEVDPEGDGTTVRLQDCGVQFYAFAFIPDDPLRRFFAVGQRRRRDDGVDALTPTTCFTSSMPTGPSSIRSTDTDDRLPTVAIPWGQLVGRSGTWEPSRPRGPARGTSTTA